MPCLSILMYHALDDQPSAITFTPKDFARQIRWLHENNIAILSLDRLHQGLTGKADLPARGVVLTFDDGFESVYTHAFPILAEYGLPAAVFLVSNYIGRQNDWPDQPAGVPSYRLLNWPQIREMARHGIDFGAHTATHPWLHRLPPERLHAELIDSKARLEDGLGQAVKHFAYPYGRYTPAVKDIAQTIYATACSTQLAQVTPNSDLLALPRLEAQYAVHPRLLSLLFGPAGPPYLALRGGLRKMAARLLGHPWA